jgi:biotin synthase
LALKNSEMPEEIQKLQSLSLSELMAEALKVKLANRGTKTSLCSIVNAKSGQCSEDCRFCVQSGHYKTDNKSYPLQSKDELIQAARQAKEAGATRFSLVTSGRGPSPAEVSKIAERIKAIRENVDIKICASLGIIDKEQCRILKDAGMSRYHHNLETSENYFSQIVSTHSFAERMTTIGAVQDAGVEVCSGGIIGLGETEEDRISMAISLKKAKIDSVPINILIPIAGTPMAGTTALTIPEILRTIALFRIILEDLPLRLAAGRETALNDFLAMAYMAGADGMMIGGYLTRNGREPDMDLKFISQMISLWKTCLPG